MTRSLTDLLDAAVARDARATALLYRDEVISFADLAERSARFAGQLAEDGIAAGERLLLCLQNVPEFVVALLGAARAGVTVVPLNPMYRLGEIERLVVDCAPAAIVCEVEHARDVMGEALPALHRFTVGDGGTFGGTAPSPATRPRDPLMLVYTSGTSGKPKGAIVSHANLLAGAETYVAAAGLRVGEPILAAAPLFHVTGLSGHIGAALAARAPLILCGRFHPDTVLDAIERHRPVFTVAAITAYAALLDAPSFAPERIASLATLFTGGAPVPPVMRDRVLAATGIALRNAYGLTETVAPVTIAPAYPDTPVDPASGALSVGQAVPGTVVRVVDAAGADCAAGEAGEIVVTGPSVIAGYRRMPEATAEAFGPNGLHTGDIGVLDGEGWLYLIDRKKDMIVASGFKVWPREVEDTLYAHPAVRQAAVIGVPDAYRGETVHAVVSLRPGAVADEGELIAFCRARLAAYKAPRHIEIRDALPMTATGKLLRRALRADAAITGKTDDAR